MIERRLSELVGGELRQPVREVENPTFDPSNEELLAYAPEAHPDIVREAITAARAAFDTGPWPGLSASERAARLQELADLLEENLDTFANAETADTGMTLRTTTQGHLPRAIAHLRYFAGEALRQSGECYPMEGAYLQLVQREPLGVVAIIAPWNAPLAVATINAAAALAVGNTVVLKSSERAPITLSMLGQLFAAVDFPSGVVNVIHGRGSVTGAAVVGSSDVDALCFVGGTETARQILEGSPNPFRRNTLELGGKSPTLIFNDARLDEALDGSLLSVFSSNGEVCTAGSRILVQSKVYDAFVTRFVARARAIRVGDPRDPKTELGPLIDSVHAASVEHRITQALAEGAVLACGGHRPREMTRGHFLAPAVLTNVDRGAAISREEVFGPVAIVSSFHDEEEAISIANDTHYGLSASVWCGDASRGLSIARRLRCGVVGVNSSVVRDIRVPFGGWRASGIGRVGGRWSIEQYTEVKTTCVRIDGYELPRMGT